MDVGEDTTGSDGGAAEESVELFVVADGELNVTGNDSALLVVLGGIAGELEDLSCEVLKDGSAVHGGTGADAAGVAALLHEAGNSSDWELKSSLGSSADGAGSGLSLASSSFSSGHCEYLVLFVFKIVNFIAAWLAYKHLLVSINVIPPIIAMHSCRYCPNSGLRKSSIL